MELSPFGVRVVLVEPGTIRTEFRIARDERGSARAQHGKLVRAGVRARRHAGGEVSVRLAGTTAPVVRAIETAINSRRPSARYVAPRKFALMIALVRPLTDVLGRRGDAADVRLEPAGGRSVGKVTKPTKLTERT